MGCSETRCRHRNSMGGCDTYDGECVYPVFVGPPEADPPSSAGSSVRPEPPSGPSASQTSVSKPKPARKKGIRGRLNDLFRDE